MFQLRSAFSRSLPNPGQWWETGKSFSHVRLQPLLHCYSSWPKVWMTGGEEEAVEDSFLAFIPSTEGDSKGWFGLCLTHIMMRTRSWIFCRSFTHCSTVKNSRLCCRCKERESVKGQGQQLGHRVSPSPPAQVALTVKVAVLGHDRRPGCTWEQLALQRLLLSSCVSRLPTTLPAGLQHMWE